MLTIILAFLLGVSTVSASNNSTSNIVTLEETTEGIMGVENNQVILEKYDGGNFLKFSNDENTLDSDNSYSNLTKSDDNEIYSYMYYCRLSSDIEKTTRYSTLKLQNDYYFGSAIDESEIEISKPITLDGNGHILNGRGVASGFYITSGDVTLKNIKFKNCRPSDSYSSIGGAIIIGESVSGSITIDNCSFYNNKASDYGGAICCQSDNVRLTIKNSYFEGNEAINGGAIYVDSFGKTVYVY